MRFESWKTASKLAAVAACCTALAACGGGGSSGSTFNPNNGTCNPGTDVQISNPSPNSSGNSTTIGAVTIVANGNGNTLYNSYANWSVILQGNFSGTINGGQLTLVPKNGTQPFPSDFYYSSSIPTLAGGDSYQVELVNNSGFCTPVTIGQFST